MRSYIDGEMQLKWKRFNEAMVVNVDDMMSFK